MSINKRPFWMNFDIFGGSVDVASPCNCVGPQDGQPLCPCQMRSLVVKNGRYVRPEQDLGPALDAAAIAQQRGSGGA